MEQQKDEKIIFCKGGGCTAKLGAGILSRVLERLPKGPADENLLIGYDSKDDAAVYRISDDTAIVQTLDFFPPMVDDPYTFGKIAAANALSDIYAMGGEVKTALNIVCFPVTSVHAWISYEWQIWEADLFNIVMDATACSIAASDASFTRFAVQTIPTPSFLVRISLSPGLP